MNKILDEAKSIKEELIKIRRTIHSNPEVGNSLPLTKVLVIEKLKEYGYQPKEICQSGIVALLEGENNGKTLMLRADMDALKIEEKTKLDFSSKNGNMHACGHDMHTAMLLGAAKILKKYKSQLNGNIKFVFQPNEEGFEGAKTMIKAGVLENPKVDCAMAIHISSGLASGMVLCGKGTVMAGCTFFRIKIKGTGCHGAMPETGVDPINIAAHIHISLQEIIAREISPTAKASLTIGRFQGGNSPNIIPQEVVLEGSIRYTEKEIGDYIFKRVEEISLFSAKLFRGEASVEKNCSVPPLKNDTRLAEKTAEYISEIIGPKKVIVFENGGMGSEDFAVYSQKIPCIYALIGAGTEQENKAFGKPMHNQSVIFNEDILEIGSAVFAQFAIKLLS